MIMDHLNAKQTFIIFSLESYKNRLHKTGKEALEDFKIYNVFEYLEEGFDVLHTQSMPYVVDEIMVYIKNRNENISR